MAEEGKDVKAAGDTGEENEVSYKDGAPDDDFAIADASASDVEEEEEPDDGEEYNTDEEAPDDVRVFKWLHLSYYLIVIME